MLIANCGEEGRRLVILGVERENITRLTAGKPIVVSQQSHPGFPVAGVEICIIFGETLADITKIIAPYIDGNTKIVDARHEPTRPQ